jgi:hypothetical protein
MQSQAASNNNNAFSVSLVSVECRHFFNNLPEEKVLSPDSLQVSHSLSIIVNDEKELDLEVGMKYGEPETDYSEIRMAFRFDVTNLSQVMKMDESTRQVSFDEALLRVIVPVAFSTARGYYSAKLEGSPLSKYPFPLLKTDALIKTCRIMMAVDSSLLSK